MEQWEKFEIECCEYLNKTYGNEHIFFRHNGGSDSTVPDIAMLKNGTFCFYVEAKMSNAQSGQFVLLPNNIQGIFEFSPKNKSKQNEFTKIITDYMNKHFDDFCKAGTTGRQLKLDTNIYAEWIVNTYIRKGVKFVISKSADFVIFPIEKFSDYFNINATFRIKKSGSTSPSKKDIPQIKLAIENGMPAAVIREEKGKLYVLGTDLAKTRFSSGSYTYYLSEIKDKTYEVRKLSNTYNMNVIFSIGLKKQQEPSDLIKFKQTLQ